MPVGTLVQIPTSVSRGGACKINLRGVTAATPYDYTEPKRNFTVGAAAGSISTSGGGAGAWANTIRWAYYSTDSEGDPSISCESVSSSTSGTLIFRIYIQEQDPIPLRQTVLYNGTLDSDGYGVLLENDGSDYNLYFTHLDDIASGSDKIKLNILGVPLDTWYQYSISFETVTISATSITTVTAYENGVLSVDNVAFINPILPATGNTVLLASFYGRITDFAILDTVFLNLTKLALFATAPYI